jgi:hypothetical protein
MVVAGVAALLSLALLGSGVPAKALVAVPAPPVMPERVALADTVIIGKVGKVEDKNVSAVPYPGAKNKVEYQVFTLQIDDAVLGAKGMKEIRIGFVPPMGGGIRPPRPLPQLMLATGQEGCFFLSKHPEESFYVPQQYFDVLDKKNPNFEKEVAQVKRCAKLLADPDASLKSKDADDRLLTAVMLITRYRTSRTPNAKTEAIGAEQSKLILEALADADWTKTNDPNLRGGPQQYFLRLGVTEKDGWKMPMRIDPKTGRTLVDYQGIPAAAKKWCKDNAGTYRIQRFVAETTDK